MRSRHASWQRAVTIAALVAVSVGCGGSSRQVVSAELADGRVVFIVASWGGNSLLMTVLPYAQVPEGTRGTLEVSQAMGPVSWHCPGTFRPWSPPGGQDLPPGVTEASEVTYLAPVGSDAKYPWPALFFKGPQGVYTFTLTVEDPRGTVSVVADNPWSGEWATPSGCTITGGPLRTSYGLSFTASGLGLSAGSETTVATAEGSDSVVLSGAGSSRQVSVSIEQAGENASTTSVQATIPGSGSEATVWVFDWTDVSASLIYETYDLDGRTRILILQDNPSQHGALVQALFTRLGAAISGLPDAGGRQSLQAKLAAAQQQYVKGNAGPATNILHALENETRAQAGKRISASDAATIVSIADQLIGLLSMS